MKRSQLKSNPDKIRAWQRRSKPLNPINRKQRAKKFKRNFGDRGEAVRSMICMVFGRGYNQPKSIACSGVIHAAHMTARGAGGCNGDRRDIGPLCAAHHTQQGSAGARTFDRLYSIDTRAEAGRIAIELDNQGYT